MKSVITDGVQPLPPSPMSGWAFIPRLTWAILPSAVGGTVTLLHPPFPLVGVSIETQRGCQQNG